MFTIEVSKARTIAATLIQSLRQSGGASINKDLKSPIDGYMVSFEGAEIVFNTNSDIDINCLTYAIQRTFSGIGDDLYFGIWKDQTNGKIYFDISENIKEKNSAIRIGRSRKQIAIYEVVSNCSIYL